jgi:hypothetical protein
MVLYTGTRDKQNIFALFCKKRLTGVKHLWQDTDVATKRKGKFVGAYIPKDIKRKLEAQATAQERPLSWVIEKILSRGVKHPTPEPALKEAA